MEGFSESFLTALHKIDENLYLGGILGASNPNLISRFKITSIVQLLSRDAVVRKHKGLRYLEIDIDDLPNANISRVIPNAMRFIEGELRNGGVVLIHCAAGVSRSASIAIAYFMIKYKIGYQQALAKVRKGRSCACPNPGFERQLKQMDINFLARYAGMICE